MRIIGIGDNVCDKYRTLSTMFPGGQALNVAVYCKQLGWDSAYLGAFGRDPVGEHVKKTLDALGIDRSRCREYDGENGYAVIDLVDGDRVFVTSNKGGVLREHPLQLTEEDLSYIAGFDLVHTSNNSYFDGEVHKLADLPVLVSYDFSYRWFEKERWPVVCPYLDFGFLSCSDLSDTEAAQLAKDIHAAGCKTVIATMGGRGVIVWDGEQLLPFQPHLVKAVDTLGAGDSFAAGFLTAWCAQRAEKKQPDLLACMEAGAALSAKTCMVRGAFGHGCPIWP